MRCPPKITMAKAQSKKAFRVERDPLGEKEIPSEALYGVQTARARENFKISRLRIHPLFYLAYAEIKRAAAEANLETGKLEAKKGRAIVKAADELIAGKWAEQFDLDVFQAGAGTSYNMSLNEVIANRALEIVGSERGHHDEINPNDDVNKSQSTNDTMPTAMRITAVRLLRKACEALDALVEAFEAKGKEFAKVKKSGRTHLHDAVPMTLGDEFAAYAVNVKGAVGRLRTHEASLLEVPLGGTAVGTGTNADPKYAPLAIGNLSKLTGMKLKAAKNKVASQSSLGDFVALSASLRCLCVELQKIANDLRLMNSGPHTALFEIELPAKQPGSSIMPGKVNPAMAEMMNMVCFHIAGLDNAISSCGEAGQLELNVMMPYVAHAVFESLEIMANAAETFDKECVREIKARPERMAHFMERSVGQAALLNEELGFMGAARVAMRAMEEERTIREIAEEEGIPTNKLE
jgi:aspartate ammonia-lyase